MGAGIESWAMTLWGFRDEFAGFSALLRSALNALSASRIPQALARAVIVVLAFAKLAEKVFLRIVWVR
jgi:hypothetical protein